MPQPLDDERREAILRDIRAGQLSCRAIARAHGVSASTVSKLARDAKIPDAFERSQTEKGARARQFDARAARQQLIEDLYGDAQRFRQRAWAPYTQIIGGQAGAELVTTKLPPLRDQQAAYTALAIAVDKALTLEKHDGDDGTAAGKTMINDLFGALHLAYHRIVAEDEAPVDLTSAPESQPAGQAQP